MKKSPRVLMLKAIETLPRCAFSIQYFPHSKANGAKQQKKTKTNYFLEICSSFPPFSSSETPDAPQKKLRSSSCRCGRPPFRIPHLQQSFCVSLLVWCYSAVWRWEIAVHTEMPTPRGVVRLWSALRAYIDLIRASRSLRTNHTQPRFPLPADGCERPRAAPSSAHLADSRYSTISFLWFFLSLLLVLGLALARMSKGSLLQALHSQSSACTSLPASLKLFFF